MSILVFFICSQFGAVWDIDISHDIQKYAYILDENLFLLETGLTDAILEMLVLVTNSHRSLPAKKCQFWCFSFVVSLGLFGTLISAMIYKNIHIFWMKTCFCWRQIQQMQYWRCWCWSPILT